MLTSSLCKRADFRAPWFANWAERIGHPEMIHRKIWEWVAISEALFERGMLAPGRRGIGFAVGQEPLSSLFASLGAEVEATDLFEGDTADHWAASGQHAASLEALFRADIVDRAVFDQRVVYAAADMTDLTALPSDTYDFLWSSCAFEHLGSLERGLDFVKNAMRLLKPGGVACHTTEFNVSSVTETIVDGPSVIYRESDMRRLSAELRQDYCAMEPMDFDPGNEPEDILYDLPPYGDCGRTHVKLELHGFICTSAIIICRKYA